MEYILSKDEMNKADERTFGVMHISSAVLMERAALAVADCVCQILKKDSREEARILVAAGIGNNGGDGFAAGRILMERSLEVDFCLIGNEEKSSPAEKEEIASVRALDENKEIFKKVPDRHYDIVIDAIFGVSLNRNVEGIFAGAVEAINSKREAGTKIVSIDIPSGIDADTGHIMGCSVIADYTVACAYKKPGLLLNPGGIRAGKIITASIGITEKSFEGIPKITAPDINDLTLPKRVSDSNKGTYGKVLIVAGSDEICGAAVLAASAALRTGCGMVRVFTHENNRVAIQTILPEALITSYGSKLKDFEKLKKALEWCDSIVIGPGIGSSVFACDLLEFLLKEAKVPMVLDADALNIIAKNQSLLTYASSDTVITPHIGEMSRLSGLPIDTVKAHPIETARDFAAAYNLVCVLKDARTVTVTPDGRIVINTSGNDGMSTAGSGDVLAGMTGSLMAQGVESREAAWRAVFLHGAAGDMAKEKFGAHTMLASDIISSISELDIRDCSDKIRNCP